MSQSGGLHTICLRSADARQLGTGVFQWTVNAANFSTTSAKAFLASIELPMSQWSIEKEWSRVYVAERIVVTPERRTLRVREDVLRRDGPRGAAGTRMPDDDASPPTRLADVTLPLHLNRVSRIRSAEGGKVAIDTEEPHGVTPAILDWVVEYEEHIKVVASAAGPIDLSQAWADGRLAIDSPTRLVVTPQTAQSAQLDVVGGYLHVPSPGTPEALAHVLTKLLHATEFGPRLSVSFDAKDCAFLLSVGAYPAPDVSQVRLEASGDGLAALMGFEASGARVFTRRPLDPQTLGYAASAQGRTFLQQHIMSQAGVGDVVPLTIRGDASSLYGHAELRPGWYVPSQRIYSTSAPLRLPDEWELQFARFFFPRSEDGKEPGLVFTDPFGVHRIAEIAPGVYTADSMAAYLTDLMNQESDGFRFDVTFSVVDERFAFACSGSGVGLAFSINFVHPRSVDPAKFGFEAAVLEGSDRYESSDAVHEVNHASGRLQNLYQITEVQGQRKFCIRPTAPPVVIGIAKAYDAATRRLTLQCVTPSKRVVSHGLARGAVVLVGASGYVEDGQGRRHESIPKGTVVTSVVVRGTESNGVTTLDVELPPLAWVLNAAEEGRCMTVATPTEPSSFCFSKRLRHTVGGDRLGFDDTTVMWGTHGVVRTRKLRIPPFISTGSHNLDHVDYVLMKLREGNRTSLVQHETGGHAMSVFGKVCLNPTFRHERHLPVELNFVGGDRLDTLTLEILNPDGSHYHFHGASWSLSLSLTTP